MCGRYANTVPVGEAAQRLRAETDASLDSWTPPGEVFPTNSMPICTAEGRHRRLTLARWGWKRDFMKSRPLINARSDKLAVSKLWRPALAHRRCLVPATCWYEWTGERGSKVRHELTAGGGLITFAGLWEETDEGPAYTIVTGEAAAPITHVHDRMPAVLDEDRRGAWLDATVGPDEALAALECSAEMVGRLRAEVAGDA